MESLSGVRCPLSDRIMTERVRCRLGVLIEAYGVELRLGLGLGGGLRGLCMPRLDSTLTDCAFRFIQRSGER